MMKIKFLKNNIRNKPFVYRPMYYDARKDLLQKKVNFYTDDKSIIESGTKSERAETMRSRMHQNWRSESNKHLGSDSNYKIRILLLILAILAIGYFIFFAFDDEPVIIKKLW